MSAIKHLFVVVFAAACAEQTQPPVPGAGSDDGKADGGGSAAGPCGGSAAHHSTIPDFNVTAPDLGGATKQLAMLGRVWTGTVSFELDTHPCSDLYGNEFAATWGVFDGNNHSLGVLESPQQFHAVKLPVTIQAGGVVSTSYFPGHHCVPTAEIKNVQFDTVGTACLRGPTIRDYFATWNGDIAYTLGSNFEPTTATFSADATFFANFSAPECADLLLVGQHENITLDAASPDTAGDVTVHTPAYLHAYPRCVSSPLVPRAASDADFELDFSTIVLGPPGG